MFTLTTAAQAVESILSEIESGDIADITVSEETLHLVRQALYALQAEEAREEQIAQGAFEADGWLNFPEM